MSSSTQPAPVSLRRPVGRYGSLLTGFLLGIGFLGQPPAAHGQQGVQVIQAPQALTATTQACPDLTPYYPGPDEDWQALASGLAVLMPRCLQSAEYFALLGAAQMNSGNIADALEMLERALLLAPDNGGAQVDYAQALFLQGQLFSALDLNRQLLARDDLPPDMRQMLQQRQQSWQGLTRQHGFQADILAGYDNNLNGAPEPGQITLTLSGDPIVLPLDEEYRPVSGPYLNLRLGARYRQLAPQHQHNVLVELRGRVSEDTESDLLQLDTRYAFIRPGREHSWQLNAGMSHLFFGGSPLYTATEGAARYMPDVRLGDCRPFVSAAAQHQLYHNQSRLNAVESKLGGGVNCPLGNGGDSGLARQQLSAELSLLSNEPMKSGRPGGGRNGWQFNLDWQWQLSRGVISSQLNHTELDDRKGYSPLLANGDERWLSRSYLLVQYRQPVFRGNPDTNLMLNLFHQKQRSNIELFRSNDSTVEIGVSHSF